MHPFRFLGRHSLSEASSLCSTKQEDIDLPPHIFHGYQSNTDTSVSSLITCQDGDLVVYFERSGNEYGFIQDIDLYGIRYGLVAHNNEHGEDITSGLILSDGTRLQQGRECPFVKLYRRHKDGWSSVVPGSDEAWEGWIDIQTLRLKDNVNQSIDNVRLRETTDSSGYLFMEFSFKPGYKSFVQRQRRRNQKLKKTLTSWFNGI